MRRQGFQESPFRRFNPKRAGRPIKCQKSELFGRMKKTNAEDIGPTLRQHKVIA
jgi:hypothetical protein